MNVKTWLLCGTAALAWTAPLFAHHSLAPMYVEDRTETVEGTLVEFALDNPHSVVYVDAPGENGKTTRWTIEWLAKLQLERQGVTSQTLKFGEHLIITGFPARNADDHHLWLRTVTRPNDRWKWAGTFE